MRQLCAHTFLVQEVLEEMIDLESIDAMESAFIHGATRENKNDRILLEALRRMIKAKPEVVEQPEDFEEVQTGELAAQLGRCLKSLKSKSNWAELRTLGQCHFCGEPPENAMVTSCLHVYCGECLQGMANSASAKDQDKTACLKCGVAFTGAESCAGLKELEWDNNWLLNQTASRKSRPKKVNMEWVAFENKLVMSAKTTAVQAQVQQWLEEEPDKKIIIFSQFHMTMQILEKVCQQKGWGYVKYHGAVSHGARDKAITEFTNDDNMKIMIASLKAGGIGLNLTMASKVLCIDLWFNSCVEQQAFCRVFRIGQDSETFITRFVVNRSADCKLMEMQLKKNALIGQAMDDRSVLGKLTVNEILRLFGEVSFDKDSRPFIHLDDDEKLDSLFEKRDEKE